MSSMSDRDFMKYFSGLIGALIALTVIIFVLAQMVASSANMVRGGDKKAEAAGADVLARIKPVGEVVLASAMTATAGAANAADKGETTYNTACVACHGAGVAGAPKKGDKAAWKDRIAQGNDKMYEHALKGFQGKKGFMPAKGGNASLADADVKAAVDFMVSGSK